MRIYFLLFFSFLSCLTYAQQKASTEIDQVQHAIHNVFEAISENNLKKLEDAVVPDVLILEKGEVWNLDTLRGFFKHPRPADFKRTNSFEFFKTEISGNLAIICYYNSAVIHANANDTHFKWLESGILRKEGNTWKLKMLHVTKLNP